MSEDKEFRQAQADHLTKFNLLIARYERYEKALRQIANDSRPHKGSSIIDPAEHWKHVASQRREWAIKALEDHGLPT